jgi:hypothetical protein
MFFEKTPIFCRRYKHLLSLIYGPGPMSAIARLNIGLRKIFAGILMSPSPVEHLKIGHSLAWSPYLLKKKLSFSIDRPISLPGEFLFC